MVIDKKKAATKSWANFCYDTVVQGQEPCNARKKISLALKIE